MRIILELKQNGIFLLQLMVKPHVMGWGERLRDTQQEQVCKGHTKIRLWLLFNFMNRQNFSFPIPWALRMVCDRRRIQIENEQCMAHRFSQSVVIPGTQKFHAFIPPKVNVKPFSFSLVSVCHPVKRKTLMNYMGMSVYVLWQMEVELCPGKKLWMLHFSTHRYLPLLCLFFQYLMYSGFLLLT